NIGDLGVVHWITMGIYFGSSGKPVSPSVKSTLVPSETKDSALSPSPETESAPLVRHDKARRKSVKSIATPSATPMEPGFPIEAQVINHTVNLSWDPQTLMDSPAAGYNVYGGLVPGAGFQKMTDKPVTLVHWSGEIGLRGITYYFMVKVVGTDGQETKSSEIKAVEIP
ncbi:MAG TPA: hypothetical protein VIJ93_11260, partial [bacterium]